MTIGDQDIDGRLFAAGCCVGAVMLLGLIVAAGEPASTIKAKPFVYVSLARPCPTCDPYFHVASPPVNKQRWARLVAMAQAAPTAKNTTAASSSSKGKLRLRLRLRHARLGRGTRFLRRPFRRVIYRVPLVGSFWRWR